MSVASIARRVAVFTLILFTSWMAATAAASAMVPDPQAYQRGPSTHQISTSAGSDPYPSIWLWAAVAFAVVLIVAIAVAAAMHRRHVGPLTARHVVH